METKQQINMSPIDSIIMMLDSYAEAADNNVTTAEEWGHMGEAKFFEGKAAGLREAADHLRNLQKLFN